MSKSKSFAPQGSDKSEKSRIFDGFVLKNQANRTISLREAQPCPGNGCGPQQSATPIGSPEKFLTDQTGFRVFFGSVDIDPALSMRADRLGRAP